MKMKRAMPTVWGPTNKQILTKPIERGALIRSSSFAEALNPASRKTRWPDPDRLEGSQSLRFANAWKNQIRRMQAKGMWNDVANKLKQLHVSVTDDDLLLTQGHEERLMARLEQRLGMTSHEVRRLIASLLEISCAAAHQCPVPHGDEAGNSGEQKHQAACIDADMPGRDEQDAPGAGGTVNTLSHAGRKSVSGRQRG